MTVRIGLIANGLFVFATLEFRIARSFSEEVLKGRIKVSQGLLQNNRAHILKKGFFRFLLPLSQSNSCLRVGNGFLLLLIYLGAQLEPTVPDKTGAPRKCSQVVWLEHW